MKTAKHILISAAASAATYWAGATMRGAMRSAHRSAPCSTPAITTTPCRRQNSLSCSAKQPASPASSSAIPAQKPMNVQRGTIITLENSFHGRTLATLAATGQPGFHQYFYPLPTGFAYAKANDLADLKAKLDGTVCAVMMELIQGEGGVNVLDKDYVQAVAQLCKENDILLIIDEVQTGGGRTGTFLVQEQYGIRANVTTLAKAIGGGLPIGVCMVDALCENVITPGTHGSTFGGNPIACAGGVAVMEQITAEGFLDSVSQKASYLREELAKIPEVDSLSGLGMMIGISLKTKDAHDIMLKANDAGLLVLTAKDKVRLLPPLTITKEEMDAGLAILRSVLEP